MLIKDLYRSQIDYQKSAGTSTSQVEDLRLQSLALIVEVGELLQEVNWKPWKYSNKRFFIGDKAKEEWVDVLLFVLNMAHSLKINPNEMEELIFKKMLHNQGKLN